MWILRAAETPTFLCAICHDVRRKVSLPPAQERGNPRGAGMIVQWRHSEQTLDSEG